MPIRPELRHHYRTPEWFAARAAVRERAGDRCERCGAKNGAYVVRRYLGMPRTIAVTAMDAAGLRVLGKPVTLIQCGCCHRNNVAGDDRPENLAWWCRGCHLRADALHHKRTRSNRKDGARPLLAEAMA